MTEQFDVITMGRVGIDLFPQQIGVGLEDVETFGKYVGGSPTNVAIAAARHGRRAAVITRTGDDPFGRFVHKALREHGVDDRFVSAVHGLPTPVTFVEVFPPDDFPLYIYRLPKAPDLTIRSQDLDLASIRQARVFWATVTGLSMEPSRQATLTALAARARCPWTVLDLDFRTQFWSSPENARRWTLKALRHATVAVATRAECEMVLGETDPHTAAKALLDLGAELAIVKRGRDGVVAATGQGTVEIGPIPVPVVNLLGTGDAFGGALVHGLLAGWDLDRTVRFAAAAGAIVATRPTCSAAMPTESEVTGILSTRDGGLSQL
ncbi:MAG: 5-dehydro-2-deoxygluconokinase [Streptosporangiaceae bacterium]